MSMNDIVYVMREENVFAVRRCACCERDVFVRWPAAHGRCSTCGYDARVAELEPTDYEQPAVEN
jgi:hypothetical protein